MSDHLICYDITDPRRLRKIYRALKRQATPVQYSVFWFRGSAQQLKKCLGELKQLMNPNTDDIRAYPLPERGLRLCFGPAPLPEGVVWTGIPKQWNAPPPSSEDDSEEDES